MRALPRQGKFSLSMSVFFLPVPSLFNSQRYYGNLASGTGCFSALARMRETFWNGKHDGKFQSEARAWVFFIRLVAQGGAGTRPNPAPTPDPLLPAWGPDLG